ncbi:MAG: Spy/CpxP family protein refolding chaperone [Actinomycetota bacterium]
MKRILPILGVVLVIGFGAFAPASGQEKKSPPGHSGGMGGTMDMGGMMRGGSATAERPWISLALQNKDQLGLTADQVTRLESLRAEFQKDAIRRSADLEIAETEVDELLRAEPVDLTKVEAKLRQLESLRSDLRLSRIKTLQQGKAVLTPEQRKKLTSLGPSASAGPDGMMAGRGMEEMQRFMTSERMPQAMAGMMGMARQMGNGDAMAGMVRMMEMMSTMGQMEGMMGGQGGGMMEPTQPKPSQ